VRSADHEGFKETLGLIRYAAEREELPAIRLSPVKKGNHRIAVWIDADGKAGMFNGDGTLKPVAQKLIDGGTTVLAVDLVYQGEFLPPGMKRLEKTRRVDDPKNSRDAACFTYGYNPTIFAMRVQDVLSAVSVASSLLPNQPDVTEQTKHRVDLVGLHGGAAWVAAAKVQAGKEVDRVALDTEGFRFATATSIDDPRFWPGAVKYGDLPALLGLDGEGETWISGERLDMVGVLGPIAEAGGNGGKQTFSTDHGGEGDSLLAQWLLR